jgi:hypothetical protein
MVEYASPTDSAAMPDVVQPRNRPLSFGLALAQLSLRPKEPLKLWCEVSADKRRKRFPWKATIRLVTGDKATRVIHREDRFHHQYFAEAFCEKYVADLANEVEDQLGATHFGYIQWKDDVSGTSVGYADVRPLTDEELPF